VSRIPIRIRLSLIFTATMAVVLTGLGLFLYLSLESDLDETLNRELEARLAGVDAIVRDDGDDLGDPQRDPLTRVDAAGFVQVLNARTGEVVGGTPPTLAERPLADPDRLTELAEEGRFLDLRPEGISDRIRIVADHSIDDTIEYIIVVGASRSGRDEPLATVATLLLIGGPVALLLTALVGYVLTGATLRPVDRMRRRADEISERDPSRRLPVPPARDEIAALGTTLNSMLERLSGALERERAFVADASHELRTPLSILKAELAVAQKGEQSRERLAAAIASAADETDRLSRLAEDLLLIARADEGRLPVRPEPVELRDVVETMRARFGARADRSGREIRNLVDPGTTVRTDPVRLEQALSNIIDNALRHGEGEISIAATQRDGTIELAVSDEGQGFPPGFDERAFERFTRADQARAGQGAGLGLAIVAAIADAQGERFGVRAADGGGAAVWLTLPARSARPRSGR
jgi:heavy metal sensor kinase